MALISSTVQRCDKDGFLVLSVNIGPFIGGKTCSIYLGHLISVECLNIDRFYACEPVVAVHFNTYDVDSCQ